MLAAPVCARASVDGAPAPRGVPLEVLEAGAPMLDEPGQAASPFAFAAAAVDASAWLNVARPS